MHDFVVGKLLPVTALNLHFKFVPKQQLIIKILCIVT